MDLDTYGIQDWTIGLSFTRGAQQASTDAVARSKFHQQLYIVASALSRLNDILSNIRGLVQAELLDSEIDSARELLRANHLRAAGAVAGVVVERHLSRMSSSRGITMNKKNPTIGDWNDKLKDHGTFDVAEWRRVQRLSDIRNLCCHDRKREPTREEVEELINDTERVIKTLA